MATELESIERQLAELHLKRMRLNSEKFKNTIAPTIRNFLGTPFVYRNNSCGHGGKFDSFRRLLRVIFSEYHVWLVFEQCQITDHGIASLQTESELVSQDAKVLAFIELGWKPCSREEYDKQREATLCEIADPVLHCEELAK